MKKKHVKHYILYGITTFLLIGVLVFAGYQALKIYIPQSREGKQFEALKSEVGLSDVKADDLISSSKAKNKNKDNDDDSTDASSKENADSSSAAKVDKGVLKLPEKNMDFVGWLSIEDTVIDYPVMKSSERDPEYYLHRNFEGDETFSGTLFIGEGCNADSDAFVIYGHNMNTGIMFGSLDEYEDQTYASEHKDVVFRTPAGTRIYRVFAAFQTKIYNEPTDEFEYYRSVGDLTKGEYSVFLKNIQYLSMINMNDTPTYPQQIMLLSTCAYHTEEGRFVVAAYRIA